MLQVAFSTMRDLPRLHEITSVMIRHGLGDEHRFRVAQEIEVGVRLQNAMGLLEQFREARVRENLEPIVARGLAVCQPGRRSHGAMLLERLVGRISDDQVHGFARHVAQPVDRVARREIETLTHGG